MTSMKLELTTKSFESYLYDVFFEQNPMTLDDDLSDSFADWLGEQDKTTITAYAGLYAHEQGKLLAEAYIKEEGYE